MDHESIQGNQVPDRYLMGKLSSEERLRFEEHFLDCSLCIEHLETLEGLRTGLRELSPERISVAKPARHAVVRLFREPRSIALLMAASLALAALSPAVFFGELRRTKDELANARKSAYAAHRESDVLARTLESERTARAGAAVAAPFGASVFTLNLTRGAGPEGTGDRILVRDPREWVILLLDRPGPPRFESYRARIATSDQHAIGEALPANAASGDMLAVGIPPGLLSAGDHVLSLEGLGAGNPRDLATYRFRVLLQK